MEKVTTAKKAARRLSSKKKKITRQVKDVPTKKYFKSTSAQQVENHHFITFFEPLMSWQKRIVICKCMEECTTSFLSLLSTVLEPIYHRGFDITSSGKGFTVDQVKHFVRRPSPIPPDSPPAVSLSRASIGSAKESFLPKLSSPSRRHGGSFKTLKNPFENVPLTLPLVCKPISHSHACLKHDRSISSVDFRAKCVSEKLPRSKSTKVFRVNTKQSKGTLLKQFNQTCENLIRRFKEWKNAEKGEFLLSLVDLLVPDDLLFLANCIRERIKLQNDLDRLPDKVLIHILSFLNTEELKISSEVCKRWKELICSGNLWKRHCFNLAVCYNQTDVLKFLKICTFELDWFSVYKDLILSINELGIQKLSVPRRVVEKKPSIDKYLQKPSTQSFSPESTLTKSISSTMATVTTEDDELSLSPSLQSKLRHDDDADADHDSSSVELRLHQENDEDNDDDQNKRVENDVAFDVRPKLIQPTNLLSQSPDEIKDETDLNFAQMPVAGVASVKRVRKLEGHSDSVLCLKFDAKRILTGSADRSARLWDVRSGRNFRKLTGHQGGVRSVTFDKDYIVTGSWDTTIMIWHIVNFTLLHIITEHTSCVSCLEMNQDILVSGSHDCTICIFEKETWKCRVKMSGHEGPITCLTLLPPNINHDDDGNQNDNNNDNKDDDDDDDEGYILSGSLDGSIILWNVKKQSKTKIFHHLIPGCGVLCMKLCGHLLAAGINDGSVTFWNFTTAHIEGSVLAHNGTVNTICFVGTRFITGGSDKLIKEWDLTTCTCLRSFSGHKDAITCVRASTKRVISSSADGTCRIWDLISTIKQTGGPYDEMNKIIIPSEVIRESDLNRAEGLSNYTRDTREEGTLTHERSIGESIEGTNIKCFFEWKE